MTLVENARKTVWLTRPDLRKLCNDDPVRFDCWLTLFGAREYEVFRGFLPSLEVLLSPSPAAIDNTRPTLTILLHSLWSIRADLQPAFPIDTKAGQQAFFWWYIFHGVPENDLFRLVTHPQRDFLAERDPTVPQDAASPISRLMLELWRRHPDLQKAFALHSAQGRSDFRRWSSQQGRTVSGLGEFFDQVHAPGAPQRVAAPALQVRTEPLRPGVNLIGFARGEFGIGEEVRMAALSMRAAGIPCSIYNVDPGPDVTQNDRRADALIQTDRPYSTNLFCMTGIDMARIVAENGPELLEGRRNIGLWPWELPEWPKEWHHAYDLVDELWAASRYTYDSYVKSSLKPVRHVPSAVTVDDTEGAQRSHFGLPEGRFLFVFSFDSLSSLARKNPMACIEAFGKAFPRGNEPVGLVVKTMRADPDHPVWQRLLHEAARDRRITILAETFSRAKLLDLYRACDCFLSLHRAEGFGRCIAEAMMLGKPVIVTGYSGNLDFTLPGGAGLVEYRPRMVSPEDYIFSAGQSWAEPDTGHCAWWMKRIVENPELRERMASRGHDIVAGAYSPRTTGLEYSAILPISLP